MDEFLVGVVGNCAAGKTTLVKGLTATGYKAVNIPQEHSVTPRFWRKLNVDYLVMLSCNLATAKRRRRIPWGQERLEAQAAKLADARANCQLYLPTDHLTIEQVLQAVIAAITKYREERRDVGEDYSGRREASSTGGNVPEVRP
ncbi:MAG: hypothetical protein ACOX2K_00600 [Bacillota bacterium]|jgi:hypothetical protein